jgi:hypothetical protein
LVGLACAALAAAAGACSTTPELSFDGESDGAAAGGDGGDTMDSPAGPDAPTQADGGADAVDDRPAPAPDGGDGGADAPSEGSTNPCDAGYFCSATGSCVLDCKTSCSNNPVQCVACNAANQVVRTVCEPASQGGTCTNAAGVQRCTCNGNDPSTCGGARQVCMNNQCYACGENGTDGRGCKGPPANKRCDDDGMGNPNDRYTCH